MHAMRCDSIRADTVADIRFLRLPFQINMCPANINGMIFMHFLRYYQCADIDFSPIRNALFSCFS